MWLELKEYGITTKILADIAGSKERNIQHILAGNSKGYSAAAQRVNLAIMNLHSALQTEMKRRVDKISDSVLQVKAELIENEQASAKRWHTR